MMASTLFPRLVPARTNEDSNVQRGGFFSFASSFAIVVLTLSSTVATVSASPSALNQHAFVHGRHGATSNYVLPKTKSKQFNYLGDQIRRPTSTSSYLAPYDILTGTSASPSPNTIIAASASATLTYLSLLAFFDRPRGYLSISDPETSLSIKQSRVPNAGLGLFITQSFPKGTVLGSYPGVLRPANTFYDGKCRQFPQAISYSWRFTDSAYVIDPTDDRGDIQNFCIGGSSEVPLSNVIFGTIFQFWRVSTSLARINEPPIGAGGCNVFAREDLNKREVVFELCRDVVAGEELFMDYGLTYDRAGYRPSDSR